MFDSEVNVVIIPHTLIGSLIAVSVNRLFSEKPAPPKRLQFILTYFVAMVFAFVSHFVLDAIPHSEYGHKGIPLSILLSRALIDSFVAVCLIIISSRTQRLRGLWDNKLLFFSAFFAVLPDIIVSIPSQSPWLIGFDKFHDQMHTAVRVGSFMGFVNQFIVSIIAMVGISLMTKNDNR